MITLPGATTATRGMPQDYSKHSSNFNNWTHPFFSSRITLALGLMLIFDDRINRAADKERLFEALVEMNENFHLEANPTSVVVR